MYSKAGLCLTLSGLKISIYLHRCTVSYKNEHVKHPVYALYADTKWHTFFNQFLSLTVEDLYVRVRKIVKLQ